MKLEQVPTPAYVIDLAKLEENCSILQDVQEKAGCKVLLAQKAYSLYKTYPLISQYLSGTTASGLYEAKLAREEFPGGSPCICACFQGIRYGRANANIGSY